MAYREISLEQGTPEWHEYRSMHIGASDASKIMGVSPWGDIGSLYREKTGLHHQSSTPAMRRGLDLEGPARARLKEQCNLSVRPCVIESIENPWMSASLDGITEDGQIVEIKCPGEKDHSISVLGDIPKHYYPQLQHQMYVADVQFAWYYSFDGFDGILLKCSRDESFIEQMLQKERDFYERLMNFEHPESKEEIVIEAIDPLWEWLSIRIKAEIAAMALESDMVKQREKKIADYKTSLIELAQGQSMKGSGISVKKTSRKGAIDYTKVPELQGVDLDKYRKEGSTGWKLEID